MYNIKIEEYFKHDNLVDLYISRDIEFDDNKEYQNKPIFSYIAIVDGKISVVEGHEISHNLKDAVQVQMKQVKDVLIHIEPTFLSVREYLRQNNIKDKRTEDYNNFV